MWRGGIILNVLRRALALALSLLLLPSLSLADPIREPPSPETLVEGHTVFTTIDAYQAPVAYTPMAQASSTVGPSGPQAMGARIYREPGVLWFNDQYLVPPTTDSVEALGNIVTMETRFAASIAVLVRADDGSGIREPCGGAVLAVNAGDPDPRQFEMVAVDLGNADVASDGVVSSTLSGLLGDTGILPVDYVESYRLVDPNDRMWVVDKYVGITRASLAQGGTTVYPFPIWAVNMLGAETFVPDTEETPVPVGEDCDELAPPLPQDATGGPLLCGASPESLLTPSFEDRPCMGYQEPSRNGYCYNGVAAQDSDHDGYLDCSAPARRYHALLHFRWEDLVTASAPVDHGWPTFDFATNGCESGTEWPCPGGEPWNPWTGDEEAEGNSHSFHPVAPPHFEDQPCPVPAANPVNHGGSTYGASGRCDYLHATARVDVYYSGDKRPPAPAYRDFALHDLDGSEQGFYDFHTSFPDVP